MTFENARRNHGNRHSGSADSKGIIQPYPVGVTHVHASVGAWKRPEESDFRVRGKMNYEVGQRTFAMFPAILACGSTRATATNARGG